MVIMALLPKAIDVELSTQTAASDHPSAPIAPLRIETPATLPDAIAGHPYTLALAATGGRSPYQWAAVSPLPDWLTLDPTSGRLSGTPLAETAQPSTVELQLSDGLTTISQTTRLLVLPSADTASSLVSWKPRWSAIPWRLWLEQGVGFLLLWLIHLLAMNLVGNLQRGSIDQILVTPHSHHAQADSSRRFILYRWIVRAATLSATVTLALWLALEG
jgi:hypothetical protein